MPRPLPTPKTFGMDAEAHRLHRYWKPSGKVHNDHAKALTTFIASSDLNIGIVLLIRSEEHHADRVKAIQRLKVAK